MAAQGASSSGDYLGTALDDSFENYGPIDVENFIDSAFNDALRGEEEMYPSNHNEAQLMTRSKVDVDIMQDGCLTALHGFTYGTDTQINLDRTIALTPPQRELESDVVCSSCRRALEKDDLDEFRTFSGDKFNSKTTPVKTQDKTNGCEIPEIDGRIELREETVDPRQSVVTELQLSDISDDVGTCWRELGPKLNIPTSKIRNLDEEYRSNRDKANALLIIWKEQEGSGALTGVLADALESIRRKSIAEKLLGVNNAKLPTCETVCEGRTISLTIKCDLDAELDNKLMLCEDQHGNKYMLKGVSSDVRGWDSEEIQKNKRFLEAVAVAAQDMGKTVEQRRQESLKRISSEVQELRQKLKRVKLDCGDAVSSDGIKNCPRDDMQSAKEVAADVNSVHIHASQGESVEQLLKSCEDQRRFCQGIYDALIKLIGEVGQPRDDNSKCIKQLCDFTKELRDQEKTFFSKIELVRAHHQHLAEWQVARLEELEKWKRAQKEQVEGVEKLLSSLLNQGKMERRESQGKIEKSQKLLHRRSEPIMSTKTSSGFGRRRTKTDSSKSSSKSQSLSELPDVSKKNNISSPVCVQRMCVMDTDKKLNGEKKDNP